MYSVLTALPPLMLMIGLFVYYRAEQAQLDGPPILSESVVWNGSFKGNSSVKSLAQEQLFIWLETDSRARGARLTAEQLQSLQSIAQPLQTGENLAMQVAPRVAGSGLYWLVAIEREGQPLWPVPASLQ